MNPEAVREALHEVTAEDAVGPVPLEAIHRRAKRIRHRRRAGILVVSLTVAGVALTPIMIWNGAWSSQTPSPTTVPTSPSNGDHGDADPGESGEQAEFLIPSDPSRLMEGYTRLADCPEALHFFQDPEVRAFNESRFGHVPGPLDAFKGGCPDVDQLEREYDAARVRSAN